MTEYLDYEDTCETNEETLRYLRQTCAYMVGPETAVEFAEQQEWGGFGLVMDASGPVPADPSEGYGPFSTYALEKTNWDAIREALNEVSEQGQGYEWAEWEGSIAYDYSNNALREVVENIETSLAGYPLLDDEAFSEMEYENALEYLEENLELPDILDASDVLSKIHELGYGDDPDDWSDAVERALDELGWRECAECSTVLNTLLKDALCRECAESYEPVCEGECTSVVVESTYVYGFMTGRSIEAITCQCECGCGGLCLPCYEEKYPYARS